MLDPAQEDKFLHTVHAACKHNAQLLHAHKYCSCLYCKMTNVTESILPDAEVCDSGKTVICPRCGIDAIVPGILRMGVLDAVHRHFFGRDPRDCQLCSENAEANSK